ncbi:zinc/iron-chelating domain-containing protein [Helicobacter monodelphidis]|uniref:YkgJ family cysteine cluster protein n=1 Tax=Helicobacter sp. 15-1451 TaxID=2004995 RepID=UPI000DCBC537|nr:YkgJ family cysteine cluster protein [Helicobacter sp. 15-1451]RAX56461.1 zinc/iron-chelating domain-containing protein [Helicobacter sp. 15-1451]
MESHKTHRDSQHLTFPCTSCGECCKHITHIEALSDFDMGNGICKFLDMHTNQCLIYETRPEICKIDAMYENYFRATYSKKRFYELNANACNLMQEKANIHSQYRVHIQ